ncbi:MAG: hypothetical protein ACXADB_00430 [Candidatus Hermodarchaeia archaeon]|jgi:hypothetical protein
MGDLLYTVIYYIIHALICGVFYTLVAWGVLRVMTKENPSFLRVYLIAFFGALLFHYSLVWLTSLILLVTGFWVHGSAVVFVLAWCSPFLVPFFYFLVGFKFVLDLKRSHALTVALILILLSIPFTVLTYWLLLPLVPILWVIKSWPTP